MHPRARAHTHTQSVWNFRPKFLCDSALYAWSRTFFFFGWCGRVGNPVTYHAHRSHRARTRTHKRTYTSVCSAFSWRRLRFRFQEEMSFLWFNFNYYWIHTLGNPGYIHYGRSGGNIRGYRRCWTMYNQFRIWPLQTLLVVPPASCSNGWKAAPAIHRKVTERYQPFTDMQTLYFHIVMCFTCFISRSSYTSQTIVDAVYTCTMLVRLKTYQSKQSQVAFTGGIYHAT